MPVTRVQELTQSGPPSTLFDDATWWGNVRARIGIWLRIVPHGVMAATDLRTCHASSYQTSYTQGTRRGTPSDLQGPVCFNRW
jgi:hypothetical protein